ncbi:hypothetical protein H1V43_37985 [Streptomyces sp. PSKA54]|uniref:Uncharacterized protein n=1 Tax=Streptomyces himalayensis subsp. aureolus TaxID=2758039 RepID=A0A7W2HKB0_9ACTN|nr:hypothetical protein [Streptomyces himalayensis]MBA4866987.1 hypothetical protein [Streptomyces himalayensis subsp. aureolus]
MRRQGLEAVIRRHQAAVQRRDTHCQAVLAAAETLATTLPQQKQHSQVAAAFKDAVPKAHQTIKSLKTIKSLPKLAADTAEAREELAEDDANRSEQGRVIEAGQKAARRLRGQMRSRLSDALNSQVMLPTWFITVLGPLPPAKDTDGWMETATDVLVYRAKYQVADQSSPSGRHPTGPAHAAPRGTNASPGNCRWDQ